MTKRTIVGGGTAELEVGKVYLNRLGLACRIKGRHLLTGFYHDETGLPYTFHGYAENPDNDLVEEV